jgi:hypothetical protein
MYFQLRRGTFWLLEIRKILSTGDFFVFFHKVYG